MRQLLPSRLLLAVLLALAGLLMLHTRPLMAGSCCDSKIAKYAAVEKSCCQSQTSTPAPTPKQSRCDGRCCTSCLCSISPAVRAVSTDESLAVHSQEETWLGVIAEPQVTLPLPATAEILRPPRA